LNLRIGDQTAASISSSLGAKLSRALTARGIQFEPSMAASWKHEFRNQDRTVNAAFASGAGPSFAVQSAGVGKDAVDLTVRLDAKTSEALSIFAEGGAEFGRAHSFQDSWGIGGKFRF
jgi:outer membrane autotransporter protein